jgi:23S rRNA (pseudouridine1915-N3)-methyltransferase
MKHLVLDFKSSKQEWFEKFETIYSEKINHFCDFEIVHLKTVSVDREHFIEKIEFEEKALLKKITSDDFVILSDERGKKFDSLQFADAHLRAHQSGKKRIVFIIGGAYGVSESVRKRAQLVISLSSMVLNHLVAESVLLEQIYRSFTIQNRIPYHNL